MGEQAAVDAVVLFLNPLELELKYWMGLLPVHFLSKLGLDESVDLVFRLLYKAKFLESRDAENPGKKGYQVLNSTDYIFLAINAVSEPSLPLTCTCLFRWAPSLPRILSTLLLPSFFLLKI